VYGGTAQMIDPDVKICSRRRLIVPDGQIAVSHVQPLLQKYFRFPLPQITSPSFVIPPSQEGRIAIVTDVGRGMRWT
jgi:hypothetical protein